MRVKSRLECEKEENAPIAGQVARIKRRLQSNIIFRQTEILTVDRVQGLQNKIVIVDNVRTGRKQGFLRGQEENEYGEAYNGRLFVAYSRAQLLMIIVGNATFAPQGSDIRSRMEFDINRKNPNGPNFVVDVP